MKSYKGLNEAFVESLKILREDHSLVKSRGTTQREILWHALEIRDPTALSIEVPARKFKPSYATSEWFWYLSQDKNVKNIGKLANIWQRIANKSNEVESNYGFWLHGLVNGKTNKCQWNYHSADSFHVYETHFIMMDKILDNYAKKYENKSYPSLKKYKLRDNIILDRCFKLPQKEMTKEEIELWTKSKMELIYA